LPVDKPRSNAPSFAVPNSFSYSRATNDALSALAKQENTTLFSVVVAGVKALLHRRSGQTDLTAGTPISTRERHEDLLEGLAGNFVDVALLRTDASGNPTFREFTRRVASSAVDAFANLAPSQLVLGTNNPMDHPLHRLWVNQPGGGAFKANENVGELLFDYIDIPLHGQRVRKTDLLVFLYDGGGFFLAADDLFERSTMSALVADYVALLDRVAADPDLPIKYL